MFTGIVQTTVPIIAIEEKNYFRTHYLRLPAELLLDLSIGSSVANNGCCLTLTGIQSNMVSFDLMKETLILTNLGQLLVGDEVNIERAARLQTEIGGHLMSGHVRCTAELTKIVTSENNQQIWCSMPNRQLMKYILHKGYIGVEGISLTVGEITGICFCVYVIPETLLRTNLGQKRLGESVNIELDPQTQVIVNTVERILVSK